MSSTLAKFVFLLTAAFFALLLCMAGRRDAQGRVRGVGWEVHMGLHRGGFPESDLSRGLWNSFQMGLWSTLLTALIAVPLAVISDRYLFPGKSLLGALILIPMILPPFVGAIGVKQILGRQGASEALLSLVVC